MTITPGHEELDRAKAALRAQAREARRTVPPGARAAHGRAIAERMLRLPEIAGASAVLLYGASPEEADPGVLEDALRELGKRIAYPRVTGERELAIHWVDSRDVLAEGPYCLLQPTAEAPSATLRELSAIVVPGVAFDPEGNRLGYGGGFYDALLADPIGTPPAIGVAFDEQVFDEVPHAAWDRPVDVLVTPTRTVRCATRRP